MQHGLCTADMGKRLIEPFDTDTEIYHICVLVGCLVVSQLLCG